MIAFGRGGALETVVPLQPDRSTGRPGTGLYFEPQTPEALAGAVHRFETNAQAFDPEAIRAHAQRFAPSRFRAELRTEIELALATKPKTP